MTNYKTTNTNFLSRFLATSLPGGQGSSGLGNAADRGEDAVVARAGEIAHAGNLAAVLANRIVEFDARPDARGELHRATVA